MTTPVPPDKKMILIFTANDNAVFDHLGISDTFDTSLEYPSRIIHDEIKTSFPDIYSKCDFTTKDNDFECEFTTEKNVSDIFKYMKYV